MKRALGHAWARWKMIARKIGDFQSRLLLSVFYFVPFAPFALGVKLLGDPLGMRASGPGWVSRPDADRSGLTGAQRQF